MDEFGEENGIQDMEALGNGQSYYWKDPVGKFVLLIDGGDISVWPISSKDKLYSLHKFREGVPLITNTALRKEFDEKRPTTTETKFVQVRPGVVSQQMVTRPLTWEELLRGLIGEAEWEMGFRGFGDSLKLD